MCPVKEKVDIDRKKGGQFSIAAKNIVKEGWPRIWYWSPNKVYITFVFTFLLLCSYYATDMIEILELGLLVILILRTIKFGHTQICVPKSVYQC